MNIPVSQIIPLMDTFFLIYVHIYIYCIVLYENLLMEQRNVPTLLTLHNISLFAFSSVKFNCVQRSTQYF